MHHFRARVGLLLSFRKGHRVEFAHRSVSFQNHAGVFPGDRRAGFQLGPGDFCAISFTNAPLGDKIVNASAPLVVAGVPVLNGGILDFRVGLGDDFHHGGVQLIFVAHRGGAAFEVTYVAPFFGDDQRTFELARPRLIDSEVRREFHGAANALRNVAKRAVGEDRGVQRGIEIVRVGHHGAHVFLHQFGMLLHGVAERTEDNSQFGQFFLEGRVHRYAVEHDVHGDARQFFLFGQRNAQPLERFQQFRIHLVQAFVPGLLVWRRIIRDVPKIRLRIRQMRPARVRLRRVGGQLFPVPPCAQAPFEQPLGLLFFRRNQADDLFVEAFGYGVCLDVRLPAVFILAGGDLVQELCFRGGHGQWEKSVGATRAGKIKNTAAMQPKRRLFVPVFAGRYENLPFFFLWNPYALPSAP